jgi:hypothetical protein
MSSANAQSLRARITNSNANILSVYLDVDQGKASNLNKHYEIALTSSLKTIAESLAHNVERMEFDAAAAHVRNYAASLKPSCKAIVLFADASGILFTHEFQVEIPTAIYWGKPCVIPYVEALDEFERHIIVVTDKWRARILSVYLGHLETSTEIQDIPHTTHIHATGMDHLEAQARDQRHADENAKKHVKHLIRALESVLLSYPSKRVLLAGNVEALGELFRLLPEALRSKIAGTLHLAMSDSFEKVVAAAAEASLRAERDSEVHSVARLIELAGGKQKAITGTVETMDAVREKKVSCLYYAEGFKAAGKVCVACGAFYPEQSTAPCSSCGSHLEERKDILDLVLIATINSGAQIEQVRGPAAQTLNKVGGIGAMLRY